MRGCFIFALIGVLATLPGVAYSAGSSKGASVATTPPTEGNKTQVENFGDWLVRCFPKKSPAPCDVFFATVRKETHQRITSVSVAYRPSKQQYLTQIAVPLGISLTDGLTVKTSTYTSPKLEFRRCDANGCYVEMASGGELVDALRSDKNSNAELIVTPIGGKPLPLSVSLKGFRNALSAMIDQARKKAVER